MSSRSKRARTPQEYDPVTGKPLSMESRARQKRELDRLREENEDLLAQMALFKKKISDLTCQLEDTKQPHDAACVAENEILRTQIDMHQSFLTNFVGLYESSPTLEVTKRRLYKQGADNAHSLLTSLLSESKNWPDAKFDASRAVDPGVAQLLEKSPYLALLQVKCTYKNDLYGAERGDQRFNIRVEGSFPVVDHRAISDMFWRVLNCEDKQRRLYGTQELELKVMEEFKGSTEDSSDVNIVYFKRKWPKPQKDQDSVFVCSRRRERLSLSSLRRDDEDNDVDGMVEAGVIAMTTTTTHPSTIEELDAAPARATPHDRNPNSDRIGNMILKGLFTMEDPDKQGWSKFVSIYSVPKQYNVMNSPTFEAVYDEGSGRLSRNMIEIIAVVANEFEAMMKEEASVTVVSAHPEPEDEAD